MWADMVADGSVKRAEISVMPLLADIVGEIDDHANGEEDDTNYALAAASRTFDLTANAFADDYFTAIIDVENCNLCHDALGTTFHSPAYGRQYRNLQAVSLCGQRWFPSGNTVTFP